MNIMRLNDVGGVSNRNFKKTRKGNGINIKKCPNLSDNRSKFEVSGKS